MEFFRLNRENIDDAISYLDELLNARIFIIQKIKLISMFHHLLDEYKNESVFVSVIQDEILIKIEGRHKLASISQSVDQILMMYNGRTSAYENTIEITIPVKRQV